MSATPPDAGMGDGTGDVDAGSGDPVVLTITKGADGSYTVYPGDEPDAGGDDMSADDDAAGGGGAPTPAPGGDQPPGGQHADSVGQALKFAMDILNADQSSGDTSSPDDQFAAGFGGPGGAGAGGP